MSKSYTPRRASKTRWLQDAPEYVLDVFDNKGKTADRYTVMFCGTLLGRFPADSTEMKDTFISYLAMSDAPTHPQGFSQWGEMDAWHAARYRYTAGKQRIKWNDLPENIRKHVISRATQS